MYIGYKREDAEDALRKYPNDTATAANYLFDVNLKIFISKLRSYTVYVF